MHAAPFYTAEPDRCAFPFASLPVSDFAHRTEARRSILHDSASNVRHGTLYDAYGSSFACGLRICLAAPTGCESLVDLASQVRDSLHATLSPHVPHRCRSNTGSGYRPEMGDWPSQNLPLTTLLPPLLGYVR